MQWASSMPLPATGSGYHPKAMAADETSTPDRPSTWNVSAGGGSMSRALAVIGWRSVPNADHAAATRAPMATRVAIGTGLASMLSGSCQKSGCDVSVATKDSPDTPVTAAARSSPSRRRLSSSPASANFGDAARRWTSGIEARSASAPDVAQSRRRPIARMCYDFFVDGVGSVCVRFREIWRARCNLRRRALHVSPPRVPREMCEVSGRDTRHA